MLGDIAEQVQLGAHELTDLWGVGAAPNSRQGARPSQSRYEKKSDSHNNDAGYSPKSYRKSAPATPRRLQGRTLPASRASRALQIVLTDPQAWARLSNDDHHLLSELPAPYGPLFAWVDAQHHDHGAQPWAALREALRGQEHEDFAAAEVAKVPAEIENDPAELSRILDAERKLRRDEEKSRLAAAAPTDPEAMAQYRALLDAEKEGR